MSKHHHHHHHNHSTGVTPHHLHFSTPSCDPCDHPVEHMSHSLDIVSSLRSELAAMSYKRDRLMTELTECKSALCSKESECETLRAQTARQTTLISTLQNRLQASENREHNIQTRCDSTIETIQREKRAVDDKNKELMQMVRRLEIDLANEESHREQAKAQLHELVRKLCCCLGIESCENAQLTPECVVNKAGEVVAELQRLRIKLTSTCETLTSCENELLNVKANFAIEKQRLTSQLENLQAHNHDLDSRCRQLEHDLQVARDRIEEGDVNGEKLREEVHGFESRCHRLQNTLDRHQNDRMTFLRTLASLVDASEPCETMIKDKLREILSDNQAMSTQLHSLKEQVNIQMTRHKQSQDELMGKFRKEESERCAVEQKLEKAEQEIHDLRREHQTLSEYLVRLSRALCWGDCNTPPAPGSETAVLAEGLLDRAERLATLYEQHSHAHTCDTNCWDHHHNHPHLHHHHHTMHGVKLRREKSCHDIPLKEPSAIYTLQRRIRVLREQVQRRDLHLELLRRKIALLEEGARNKSMIQSERDDALNRIKKAQKQAEKLSQQLLDAKTQIAEVKGQLTEAVEQKMAALERAKKVEELSARICELENENSRLVAQISAMKDRLRAATESSQERRCRDEVLINSLKDDISRLQNQLSDSNHRLSHLQQFRTCVARTLHLRDIPEPDLLHRLQTLCNAHQEFTLLTKRYESCSPIGEHHHCSRFEDIVPPTVQCRPLSSSSTSLRHNNNNHHHHNYSAGLETLTLNRRSRDIHGSGKKRDILGDNSRDILGDIGNNSSGIRGRQLDRRRHHIEDGRTRSKNARDSIHHHAHNCQHDDSSNYNDDHFDSDLDINKKY